MKSSPPALAPILRSDTQGRVLASVFNRPGEELSLTELAAAAGVSVPTILRDVDRLVSGGFLRDRRVGRSRLVTANPDHPLFGPLREIVMYGYGPGVVIPQVFGDAAGVDEAVIYGSWAARDSGMPGPDPRDIDLLIVGRPDTALMYELGRKATREIGREVNVTLISADRWKDDTDGFVKTIRSRPYRTVLPRA